MDSIPQRGLSADEAAVVTAVLERAPLLQQGFALQSPVASLRVVGRCKCGCDSLFFAGIESDHKQFRIADGLGYTSAGEEIGIILWANDRGPVHLELYNYAEHPARLPMPDSICPYQQSRRTAE